ncbi:MAG: TonB-dependent receptor [Bryobacterales bacterium]|nr:TonB-dependent receptor [Bryobacterales bacterium]
MFQNLRLVVALVFTAAIAYPQATSQIQGVVQDASGAAIPGAEVKATQTDTGVVRSVTTSAEGTYVLPDLPIGPYKFEVSKSGFAAYEQTGIVLQVATNPTIDVQLRVGAVSERVQVEANAAQVELQTTSIGGVIENQRIVELPLNGRNAAQLIQLAGASIPGGANATAGMPGGLQIAVAGGQLSGVGYYLDGTMYNNLFDAVNLPFPFPEALQEFKVETSTLGAQDGTHSAASVSAVVKSGTNEYHGSLFEFLRNGDLNARNFFASSRDSLKRNQYGGTFGGPAIHNKLFFFVGYQGTRTRSDPSDRTAFVPSQQMLTGDFSGCSTFPATIKDPLGGVFANKQIPVNRFSPQALNIVKFLPKSTDPCGRTTFGPITQINEYQVLGRMDYQISDKQTLFGRYMATTFYQPSAYALSKNILDTAQGGLDDLAQTWAIGHTYLFSPTTINSFRASYNRVAVFRFSDDYFDACDVGVTFSCLVPHQTVVTVTGGFSIGAGTNIFASFVPTNYTVSDDVNVVRGNHQLAFGFSGFHYQHSQKANVYSSATFSFTGLPTATGLGMTDFLLGQIGSMTQGSPNTVFTTRIGYGLYGQDIWKISRRLTVNLGLRWEPFLPQRLNNGAVYTFDWNRFLQGVHSTVFKNAPAGLLYAGDPGFAGLTGVQNRYDEFAPRVGIALDPKGDGKTSIRSSFGISYDFPNIQIMSTPATAPPFGNALVGIPGPLPLANPWSAYPGGNPFPGSFGPTAPFIQFGTFVAEQPNAKATTVYTWNFAVQRQIGDWLFSANYLGTQTAHLWVSFQLNPAQIVPSSSPLGTCPPGVTTGCNSTSNTLQRRLAYLINPSQGQYLGPLDQFESGGTVSYNGLILTMQKRLSRNVSLNANYTWSHCIGDVGIGSLVGGTGGTYEDITNRRRDRGNCETGTLNGTQALDRRHIVNVTGVLETPRFRQEALHMAASDWKLSTSYRYLSAAFLTASTGIDYALVGGGGQRPNQILQNPLLNAGGPCANTAPCVSWLNPAAFAQPAFGTYGNLGRANIPGPNWWEIDMAMSRVFRVRERVSLEARGEAFNLTNSFRAGNVTLGRNSTQFGQILSAQDPRIMQVAMKLTF